MSNSKFNIADYLAALNNESITGFIRVSIERAVIEEARKFGTVDAILEAHELPIHDAVVLGRLMREANI